MQTDPHRPEKPAGEDMPIASQLPLPTSATFSRSPADAAARAEWETADIFLRMLKNDHARVVLLFSKLEKLLHTSDDGHSGLRVRERIAAGLLDLGSDGEEIVRRACLHPSAGVRRAAATALAENLSMKIKEEYHAGDGVVRLAICEAVVSGGRSWDLDLVAEAVQSGDGALQKLGLRGVRRFLSQDPELGEDGRPVCLRDLREPRAQSLLFETYRCLESSDPEVAVLAGRTLAAIGPAAHLNFLSALTARNPLAREAARSELLQSDLRGNCPLGYALENGDARTRTFVARGLRVLAAAANERLAGEGEAPRHALRAFLSGAVDLLTRLSFDYSAEIRIEAIRGLGAAGSAAEPALPVLRKFAAQAETWKIRTSASQAILDVEGALSSRATFLKGGEPI